ncbi:MAG: prepilin-type N-terminal cleavage/methylation domain-containing protein [Verrucomicrobia bacterium]|nr:prepilin-type N-terminal cleavage/methylation domain-containing protein [Verrucomicrobiota bacterium]
MQITTNRKGGFTLVEIMIVVAIIGLLAAIAIPNFVKARTSVQKNACIANLRQIEGAKEQWALENKKTEGAATTGSESAINAFLRGGNTPSCPGNGSYTYGAVGTAPTCSLGSSAGHTL